MPLHYITLHYIALQYIALHYIALEHIRCIHCIHYIQCIQHTYIHRCMHACKHAYRHTFIRTCIHIYIYTPMHIHILSYYMYHCITTPSTFHNPWCAGFTIEPPGLSSKLAGLLAKGVLKKKIYIYIYVHAHRLTQLPVYSEVCLMYLWPLLLDSPYVISVGDVE